MCLQVVLPFKQFASRLRRGTCEILRARGVGNWTLQVAVLAAQIVAR